MQFYFIKKLAFFGSRAATSMFRPHILKIFDQISIDRVSKISDIRYRRDKPVSVDL